MLFEKVKMSVEVEMFTLIIFHKIKENIRSDNKEWIQAHTTADKTNISVTIKSKSGEIETVRLGSDQKKNTTEWAYAKQSYKKDTNRENKQEE